MYVQNHSPGLKKLDTLQRHKACVCLFVCCVCVCVCVCVCMHTHTHIDNVLYAVDTVILFNASS